MGFWFLVQGALNFAFFAGFTIVWIRLQRPQKDDPRMSKGLQLLQSKIAILEDLSDRTEAQSKQLISIMENKAKEISLKLEAADKAIESIGNSMQKSLEVAKIFQDKIPHEEIIERQNTVKFVKAALLAHQGRSETQIASLVDLSQSEIDFIVKVNKKNLSFDPVGLPDWVKAEVGL